MQRSDEKDEEGRFGWRRCGMKGMMPPGFPVMRSKVPKTSFDFIFPASKPFRLLYDKLDAIFDAIAQLFVNQ